MRPRTTSPTVPITAVGSINDTAAIAPKTAPISPPKAFLGENLSLGSFKAPLATLSAAPAIADMSSTNGISTAISHTPIDRDLNLFKALGIKIIYGSSSARI